MQGNSAHILYQFLFRRFHIKKIHGFDLLLNCMGGKENLMWKKFVCLPNFNSCLHYAAALLSVPYLWKLAAADVKTFHLFNAIILILKAEE